MRRLLATAAMIVVCGTATAQIPVTDFASGIQRGIEYSLTATRWVNQVRQLTEQFEKLKETHEALSGVRNLGDIFDDPKLRAYLPEDMQSVYLKLRKSGYEGAVAEVIAVYNKNKIHDGCAHIAIDDQRKACEARALKGAQDQHFASIGIEATNARAEQIAALQAEINNTEDMKAIGELNARIAIERASIANQDTQLRMLQLYSQSEDRLLEQRQAEMQDRIWSGREYPEPEPLTFD